VPKPTQKLDWATAPNAESTPFDPGGSYKAIGFQRGFRVAAGVLNWALNRVDSWLTYLDTFEAETHTWTANQTFNGQAKLQSLLNLKWGSSTENLPAFVPPFGGATGAWTMTGTWVLQSSNAINPANTSIRQPLPAMLPGTKLVNVAVYAIASNGVTATIEVLRKAQDGTFTTFSGGPTTTWPPALVQSIALALPANTIVAVGDAWHWRLIPAMGAGNAIDVYSHTITTEKP
jgi:hypothetical protein